VTEDVEDISAIRVLFPKDDPATIPLQLSDAEQKVMAASVRGSVEWMKSSAQLVDKCECFRNLLGLEMNASSNELPGPALRPHPALGRPNAC